MLSNIVLFDVVIWRVSELIVLLKGSRKKSISLLFLSYEIDLCLTNSVSLLVGLTKLSIRVLLKSFSLRF